VCDTAHFVTMQQDSVETVTQALEKFNIEKAAAAHVKKECDLKKPQQYYPTWHCRVGRNLGRSVTQETKPFSCFCLGQVATSLFKSGGLCHTPSDPPRNKECSLNSKHRRLKSSAMSQGTPQSLNLYCVVCTGHSPYEFVIVVKQLVKWLTVLFIFSSIPLPHVFSPQNPFLSKK
uniref:Dynein light chain n=1 Tax=Ursus americanus TaxID=9643 RepID=A0A452QBM8_URSAM